MKKLVFLLLSALISFGIYAQAPNKISYQAVVRDASNDLVANQSIGIKVTITEGSIAEYIETHIVTTNTNGLFSIIIGDGTVTYGDWINLDWDANTMSIDTEIDLTGGTNYTIGSNNRFNSVPYAFHAQTAISAQTVVSYDETDPKFFNSPASGITNTSINLWNGKQDKLTAGSNVSISGNTISVIIPSTPVPTFYLGQDTLGGIVGYIYLDNQGEQHGLIVSKTEGVNLQWQSYINTFTYATSTFDGVSNTNLMNSQAIPSPAKNWVTSNFNSTWYIPAIDELMLIFNNRYHINKSIAGSTGNQIDVRETYWSSTEDSPVVSYGLRFGAYPSIFHKMDVFSVRAVKKF